ncbi:hypothetical protein DFJ73DRAFT_803123 [Zopfochytrium polystomum]|nr:hypothetical protein DFJ73DRAFT_803123 [Zopfochytrium polystomum]
MLGTALGCSRIVLMTPGVPAGTNDELSLVPGTVFPNLHDDEMIAADRVFEGINRIMTKVSEPTTAAELISNRMIHLMAARHEGLNKKFREFEQQSILAAAFAGLRDFRA